LSCSWPFWYSYLYIVVFCLVNSVLILLKTSIADLRVSQQSCQLVGCHKGFCFISIEFIVISELVFENLSFVLDIYRTVVFSIVLAIFYEDYKFSTLILYVLGYLLWLQIFIFDLILFINLKLLYQRKHKLSHAKFWSLSVVSLIEANVTGLRTISSGGKL
jgi:hypothetical protein